MVDIDSNFVMVAPLKNKTDGEMRRTYLFLFNRVKSTGFVTKKNVIDNEISNSMRTLIRTECNLELELVPPHFHIRNVAEVAIK